MESSNDLKRILSRIEKVECDIREVSQCIVYMCECVRDIHVSLKEA
jgi:hypothetical protein